MNGGFDHSPGVASGTDTTARARPRDEKIVTASGASSAGKAMRENAALEILAELTFDMGRAGSALAAVVEGSSQVGEVRLHGAIEHGAFGPATAIDGRASTRAGGRPGYVSGSRETKAVPTYSHHLSSCKVTRQNPAQVDPQWPCHGSWVARLCINAGPDPVAPFGPFALGSGMANFRACRRTGNARSLDYARLLL